MRLQTGCLPSDYLSCGRNRLETTGRAPALGSLWTEVVTPRGPLSTRGSFPKYLVGLSRNAETYKVLSDTPRSRSVLPFGLEDLFLTSIVPYCRPEGTRGVIVPAGSCFRLSALADLLWYPGKRPRQRRSKPRRKSFLPTPPVVSVVCTPVRVVYTGSPLDLVPSGFPRLGPSSSAVSQERHLGLETQRDPSGSQLGIIRIPD